MDMRKKDDAVFLTYIAAEALNNSGDTIKHLYGRFGVKCCLEAIKTLAKEYNFEAPIISIKVD